MRNGGGNEGGVLYMWLRFSGHEPWRVIGTTRNRAKALLFLKGLAPPPLENAHPGHLHEVSTYRLKPFENRHRGPLLSPPPLTVWCHRALPPMRRMKRFGVKGSYGLDREEDPHYNRMVHNHSSLTHSSLVPPRWLIGAN